MKKKGRIRKNKKGCWRDMALNLFWKISQQKKVETNSRKRERDSQRREKKQANSFTDSFRQTHVPLNRKRPMGERERNKKGVSN